MSGERGSASLLTVLLLPLLVLVLGAVLDLGVLRQAAARVRAAADLAALVAVNDQDETALAERGELRLAADGESVARDYLERNLVPLAASLAATAPDIVASADIAVFPDGGTDPRDGRRYESPTVRVFAEAPLRVGVLRAVFGPSVLVRAHSAASAR